MLVSFKINYSECKIDSESESKTNTQKGSALPCIFKSHLKLGLISNSTLIIVLVIGCT